VFGRDAVRLFSYSTVMDDKADVFTRFCTDVLGLEDVPAPKFLGDKRWASMPRDEAEILRALNAMYLKEMGETTVGLRNMIMWKRVPIDRALLGGAMAGETAELAINDRSVHFDEPYRRMTEFADRVVPGPGVVAGEIFDRRTRKNAYAHQGWLVEPGVAENLRALYGQMKEAMRKPG
jgi:hypothetical protein